MARYVKEVTINQPEDFVEFIMNDYIQKGGFKSSQWKGEPCFRCGDGFLEGFKYLKWSYTNGVIRLEAWMKGVFGKEMGLEGFYGALPKKIYKSNLEELTTTLQQKVGADTYNGSGTNPYQPIPVKTVDHSGNAAAALILGIISIPLCFFPIFGLIVGCISFGLARSGMASTKRGMAVAGRVCAIIGVVLAIILWILNIIVTVAAI